MLKTILLRVICIHHPSKGQEVTTTTFSLFLFFSFFYLISFHSNFPAAALPVVIVTREIPTGELSWRHHQLLRTAASWMANINHTYKEKNSWSADALATASIEEYLWALSADSLRPFGGWRKDKTCIQQGKVTLEMCLFDNIIKNTENISEAINSHWEWNAGCNAGGWGGWRSSFKCFRLQTWLHYVICFKPEPKLTQAIVSL